MSLPRINTNLNNVSSDYFLRGAEAAKPQAAKPAANAAPQDAGGPVAPRSAPHPAGQLLDKLDVLLLKAARNSTKSLDGATVRGKLQQLVTAGILSEESLSLLAKSADAAAEALRKLDDCTGADLAKAFDKKGRFQPKSGVGRIVAAAVSAQQTLSDLLAQLGKALGAMSRAHDRKLLENPGYQGKDVAGDFLNQVNDMRALCDRRATEINRLAYQMKDFAVHRAAQGKKSDPNVVAILNAKVDELLPRQALAMHGTADALATVNREFSEKLRPLAERIDALRNAPTAGVLDEELEALQSEVSTMKAAVEEIRLRGIEAVDENGFSAPGRMSVAGDILDALRSAVDKAGELLKEVRAETERKVLDEYVKTTKEIFGADKECEEALAAEDINYQVLFQFRDAMIDAMRNLVNVATDKNRTDDDLKNGISNLWNNAQKLIDAASVMDEPTGENGEKFRSSWIRMQGALAVTLDLCNTIKNLRDGNRERFFTGAEALAVFEGRISVSSLVEARIRGLADKDVDPANEDANIVAERKLGSGAAGSVYELQRSDGTSVVFKGETESRAGLSGLAAGSAQSYAMAQKAANLNIASKAAANAIGAGDLIVNYSVGVHNGVFGFYMEKAPGVPATEFFGKGTNDATQTGLLAKDMRKLSSSKRRQIAAEIKRQLNRLQWIDLLSGQTDRHSDNYFIHVDPKTLKVTVTGIDNDAGFSRYRTGAVKFTCDEEMTENVQGAIRSLARSINGSDEEAEFERMLHDPGIGFDENGMMTVDASKIKNKEILVAVQSCFGSKTLAVPDKIGRTTYEALMALKNGQARHEYLDSIQPRLSPEGFAAAVSRLDDVIAQAERLEREHKVVEDKDGANGWLDAKEEPFNLKAPVEVRRADGKVVEMDQHDSIGVNAVLCPSFYARDFFSMFFDAC